MEHKKSFKLSNDVIIFLTGITTTIVGIVVLIGWISNSNTLKTFALSDITMKANAAICFFLSGLSLLLLQRSESKINLQLARVFSVVVTLFGFAVLLEYLFDVNFGIDELFFLEAKNAFGTSNPGRMSPNTALNFVLLGIVLFSYSFRYEKKRSFAVLSSFIVAFTISLLALLGYAIGFVELTGLFTFTKMAINTSLTFIILCTGIYFTMYNRKTVDITLEYKLLAVITVISILTLSGSLIAISSIKSLVASSESVEHTQSVKEKLGNISEQLFEFISSDRGYLITGNSKFLDDWYGADKIILEDLNQLSELTKDNPRQQETIIKLKELINQRIEFSKLLVSTYQTKGQAASNALFATLKGKRISDGIGDIINQMMNEEARLYVERNAFLTKNVRNTFLIIILTLGAQITLLIIIFVFVKNDITGRRKAEAELQKLNEELEKKIEERTAELIQSEEKSRKAFQTIPDAIIISRVSDGKILEINEAFEKRTGFSRQEAIGRTSFDLNFWIDKGERDKYISLIKEKESIHDFETQFRMRDGSIIDCLISTDTVTIGKDYCMLTIVRDVTEKKKIERALQKEKDKAVQYFDTAGIMMIILDGNGFVSQINKKGCDVLGYSKDEIIGKDWFSEFLPKNIGESVRNVFNQIMNEEIEGVEYFQNPIVNKKSEERLIQWHNVILRDLNGNPIGTLSSGEDITEKVKEEKFKQRQNEILQSIVLRKPLKEILEKIVESVEEVETSSICSILLLDENKKQLRLGSAPHFPDFYNNAIDGIEIGENVGSCGAAAYTKKRVIAEDLLTHPNWLPYKELILKTELRSCWSEPLFDEKGNVLGTFAIYHKQPGKPNDEEIKLIENVASLTSLAITNQKALQEVEEQSNLLKKLSQRVPGFIYQFQYWADGRSCFPYASEGIRDLFELAPADVKEDGTPIFKKIYREDLPGLIESIKKSFETFGRWEYEFRVQHDDNRIIWLRGDAMPDKSEGESVLWHGYLADVTEKKETEEEILNVNANLEIQIERRTQELADRNERLSNEIEERKKIEEELIIAKKEAERANLAKSEFLSRMSHELRTPMNAIIGFAQLLLMGELTPPQEKNIKQILKSGKHLLDLINEVLDMAKIESGKISISTEPIVADGIIFETIDIVKQIAEEKNIRIEYEPSEIKNVFVKADVQRLKQVLINLLNNAIKYNKENGSVKIKCGKGSSDKLIRISITDTGKGIPNDKIEKIFLPFERIGAESTEIEGTGLGLSISKKIIELMSGSIGVESDVGKGTTFWIELEKAKSLLQKHKNESEYIETQISKSKKEGTILYIEDNVSNIELISQIIENHRSSLKLITNMYGENAVQLAIDFKPDLILLDLDLPDIHGSEVLKRLKADKRTSGIPVIVLSADAMTKQIEKLLATGANDYLTKPFDVLQFLKMIDEYLS